MAKRRDNFNKPTIDILAKRVGYLCSNPVCQKLTVGANEDQNKSTSIGIAAHITAASKLGPRYDEHLTFEERSSFENGIWLCSNCATLIDRDIEKYTKKVLFEWKKAAEDKTTKLLSGEHGMKYSSKPIIEVDITGASRSRYQNGASAKNPFEMYEGQRRYMNPVIFHWVLSWNFKLIILNNSSYPAYNLQIENIGQVQLDEFKNLPRKNNLSPHNSIEIDLVYTENIECDAKSADTILKPRFPEKFADLVLRINYVDEQRSTNFSTLVQFEEGEITNQRIL